MTDDTDDPKPPEKGRPKQRSTAALLPFVQKDKKKKKVNGGAEPAEPTPETSSPNGDDGETAPSGGH